MTDHSEAWRSKFAEWRAAETGQRMGSSIVLLEQHRDTVAIIVAAWDAISPRGWRMPDRPVPEDDRDAWQAIWPTLEGLSRDASRATGLPESAARMAIEIAVSNRMIYPDGTLARGPKSFLVAESAALLKRAGMSQKKPAHTDAPTTDKATG